MFDPLVERDVVTLGVLSDTHLPYRLRRLPDQVLHIFKDVDLILHAGDVDRIEYLDDLAALAPLHAVRGNFHFADLSDGGRDLPLDLELNIAGRQVVVNHGGWPGLWSQAGDWFVENFVKPGGSRLNERIADRLARRYPQADVIVFGHSHLPYQAWHNRTFVFNPGAVCPTFRRTTSVGRLYLTANSIEAEIIPLTL
ncbi:MAG: metallophosphoesterase family protein [Anaerolineae bacterium]